jgi:P4 family phage/plasmid primase-like protien
VVATSQSHRSTADSGAATLWVSFFPNRTDTTVTQQEMPLGDLIALLSHHNERAAKDGPMFACVRYRTGATRSNEGVAEVTALVYDVDEAPRWDLLEPYRYCAFTTHSHGTTKPQAWRVVLFLPAPIAPDDYPEAWERVGAHLVPNADPGAKAMAQPHYQPSYPPGAAPAIRDHDGVLLDWHQLEALPEQPKRERRAPGPARRDRPGDDFNARADWADVLPDWTYVHTCRDGTERWRRSGKDEGWSATINYGGSDMLYVWTSNAKPLEPRTSYTKFGAYAALHHDGDHAAAAKALAAQGYGTPTLRLGPLVAPPTLNGNGHGSPPDGPPPEPPDDGATAEAAAPRDALARTDLGNARLFADHYRGNLRYCHPWRGYLIWDGTRWAVDQDGQAAARGKTLVRLLYAEATKAVAAAEQQAEAASGLSLADPRRAALGKATEHAIAELKWALQSAKGERLAAMLKLAQSEPGVPVRPAALNTQQLYLTVQNGALDLRTGVLGPAERAHLSTKQAPVAYDAAAPCPTWERFLARVLPDAAVRTFIQRAVGYSLTGDIREQVLFLLYGLGDNGKSTFIEVLRALLGEYSAAAAFDTFLHQDRDGVRNDIAALFGARLVTAVEVEQGRRLNETLVKAATGGDPLTGRFLFQELFSYVPTFKLWLAANHKPVIRGTEHAIWRRIRLIPFTEQIPIHEQDKELLPKLRQELPGILRWAVAGCLAWQREGLDPPEAVTAATQEYREEMDTLGGFIADCCVLDPATRVTSKALHEAYTAWCEANGEKPMAPRTLGIRLKERGIREARTESARGWAGIGLRTARHDA